MSDSSDRRPLVTLAALALLVAGLLLVLRSSGNDYAQYLRRARAHADRTERTAAVLDYREAARFRPRVPLPHLELAQVYLDWGRHDEALSAVAEAERLGAEPAAVERLRMQIHVGSAETAVVDQLSHWEAAVEHGERLKSLEPDDREARMTLSRAYLHLRRWREGRSMVQELVRSDLSDAVARERLGALLLGADPEAFRHLYAAGTDLSEQLLAVFEDGAAVERPPYAHVSIGRVLIEHGKWALAARQLERAVELHPGYADAHAYLGHALDRLGYRDAALTHLSQAVALEPSSAVVHVFLGLTYDRRGDTSAARTEYERAYDLAPDNPAICLEIGQSWAAEGRYVAAEIWLQEAVSLRPDDPNLWEVLARFYLEHNISSNDRALEAAEQLLKLAPESARAHELRGWAALQLGRYAAAERYLQRAIELDPALASAHYRLGLVWSAQGKEGEVEQAFDRAIDLDTTGVLVPMVERAR